MRPADRGEREIADRYRRNRHGDRIAGRVGGGELALPPPVQQALGQLSGAVKEGLRALSVGDCLGPHGEVEKEKAVAPILPPIANER